jgi:uncharacterized membrane protein
VTTAAIVEERARWSVPYASTLARVGRFCVAGALVGFAIANVVVGDVVPGRAPVWPGGLPGRLAFAYATAALLLVAAVFIIRGSRAVWPLVGVSATIAAWALLRNIPAAIADHQVGGAWTMLGKSVALAGGTLGVAASVRRMAGEPVERWHRLDAIGRWSLGAFFLLAGIQHFLFAQFVKTLVPAWIPGALGWTYVAGTALIASGIGLAMPRTCRLAAAMSGAMVLTWLFVLHIPRGVTMNNQNEWTAVIEALAFGGMAWAMVERRWGVGSGG